MTSTVLMSKHLTARDMSVAQVKATASSVGRHEINCMRDNSSLLKMMTRWILRNAKRSRSGPLKVALEQARCRGCLGVRRARAGITEKPKGQK